MNAYRFAPNVQAWVDPLGLSPEDIEKIRAAFNATVKDMSNKGLRRHPLINNTIRAFGGGTLDCGEQTEYMIGKLENLQLDDNWIFMPHAEPGHAWGVAVSSNPDDPYISFDTRANNFTVNGRCSTCYGWWIATWGSDKLEYPKDVLYLRGLIPRKRR